MNSEISSANPVVKALIEGTAPMPARLAAARGALPLPQEDLLEVLVNFAYSSEAELAGNARETLESQNEISVIEIAGSANAPIKLLNYFAEKPNVAKSVFEVIVRNPKTPSATLIKVGQNTQSPELLDLLSLNQQLLIKTPELIEAILSNPNRTSEADRRATETKQEFFEKEFGQQQIAEELRAQGNEAAAEFFEKTDAENELSVEDAMFIASMIEVPDSETDDSWMGLEYVEELYDESPEQREAVANAIIGDFKGEGDEVSNERVSMINRILKMGMKARVQLAMKGDREARNILIRDPNRIVSQAVVNNPRITEQEVEKISSMRTITEDILRQLANNRQWSKSYTIIHNLARNPRTPLANVMTILTRLQLRDLTALSKNRNISDGVRRQADRLVKTRAGR